MEQLKHTFPVAEPSLQASSKIAANANSPARRFIAFDDAANSTMFPLLFGPQPHRPKSLATTVFWATPTATVSTSLADPANMQAILIDGSPRATDAAATCEPACHQISQNPWNTCWTPATRRLPASFCN